MYARAMPAIAYAKRTKAKPRLRLITKKYTACRVLNNDSVKNLAWVME